MASRTTRLSRRPGASKYDTVQASSPASISSMPPDGPQRPAKKRRTGTGSDTPPEPSGPTLDSSKSQWTTYRVSQIPDTYEANSFRDALRVSLQLEQHTILTVHSFASYGPRQRIATITFSDTPPKLHPTRAGKSQVKTTEWVVDIVHPLSTQTDTVCIDTHFTGFTPVSPLHNDKEHLIDCIAIHGWGSHALGGFKAHGDTYVWLRDSLVKDVPQLRVFIYGYTCDLTTADSISGVDDYADTLRRLLRDMRDRDKAGPPVPLVFIAHSLGGLVLKQALILMKNSSDRDDNHNLDSVYGALFFGVPSQGMDTEALAAMVGDKPQRYDLSLLNQHVGHRLRSRQHEDFCKAFDFEDSKIIQFFETRMTFTVAEDPVTKKWTRAGPKKLLVNPASATYGRPWETSDDFKVSIDADHSDMVKFPRFDQDGYIKARNELQKFAKQAILVVERRFRRGSMNDVSLHCHSRKDVFPRNRTARPEDPGPATTTHGKVHWMVPRTVNNLFTGRTELLLRIQKALHNEHTSPTKQKRFVITGLGGQGKSEVCLQVASLMREQFWGIFWVDVNKPSTAESDFIAIGKNLGHSVESVPEALQILATANPSWLLILDNADDPNFDYQVYLPSGTYGAVLMTSRVIECKRYSPDAFEALEGLEDKDAKELLLQAAEIPQESWPSYDNQAGEVVRLLGSHTLALIQAGAYIARGHCQLHQYPGVYQQQRKRLLKYRPNQAQSRYCDVYATFEASADVLEHAKTEAAKDALCLLKILSMLDSSVLPLQVFEDAWNGCGKILSTDHAEASGIDDMCQSHVLHLPSFMVTEGGKWDSYRLFEASSLLISLSLVTRHDLNGLSGLSMHLLTHAWAKDRQDKKQQSAAWITAGCVLAFSRSNIHMWQTQERCLLPHIRSYLDTELSTMLGFGPKATVIPILLKCGWALLDMRQDSRLGRLLEDVFFELGQNPKEPVEESLLLYDLQARSLINLGKNGKAMALLEQVVKIKETTLAEDHPSRLTSQHELACAYQANGQVRDAVALLEQVVKIEETTLAEDHPSRLASQHELARAYQANGQVRDAVALLEQIVRIKEITLAEDHPSRLASQHELASAYQTNGQVRDAVALLEQVVKIQETTLAEDHPSRLASQHELARAYQANGQVRDAVGLLEQVVKIYETTLAEDHPSLLASQHQLACAYQANGQVRDAVALLEQVVKIQETTLAEDHPNRLASQHALAWAYEANGRVKEAVELLKQVAQIKRFKFHDGHPSRVVSEELLSYFLEEI